MACAASDLESQAWAPVQAGLCSVWENRPKFGSGFRPTAGMPAVVPHSENVNSSCAHCIPCAAMQPFSSLDTNPDRV